MNMHEAHPVSETSNGGLSTSAQELLAQEKELSGVDTHFGSGWDRYRAA